MLTMTTKTTDDDNDDDNERQWQQQQQPHRLTFTARPYLNLIGGDTCKINMEHTLSIS